MANHFYAYISRMRCVKRWALMRNTEEENIQEHSHMVAVLAHALALIRTRVFGLPTDANAVAVAALYHDATEILTGDMPTPIKYYNPRRLPQGRGCGERQAALHAAGRTARGL